MNRIIYNIKSLIEDIKYNKALMITVIVLVLTLIIATVMAILTKGNGTNNTLHFFIINNKPTFLYY